jgi:hypothetical protein
MKVFFSLFIYPFAGTFFIWNLLFLSASSSAGILSSPSWDSSPKMEKISAERARGAQGSPSGRKKPPASSAIGQAKVLTDVNIIPTRDSLIAELKADGEFPEWQSFRLDDPPRLVIDFPELSNSSAKRKLYIGHRFLKELRIGQHEDKVRVVFTFPEPKGPALQQVRDGRTLRFIFGLSPEPKPAEKKPLAKVEPSPIPSENLLPQPAPPKPEVAETKPIKPPRVAEKETKAPSPSAAMKPTLPAEISPGPAKESIPETKSPQAPPRAAAPIPPLRKESASPAPTPKRPTPAEAETTIVASKAPTPEAQAPRTYHGERLSLDFRDADLRQVFQLIAQVGKRRIILSDEVRERITIRLLDVPWDQALDIILEHKNLRKFEDGNVIRIQRN